LLHPLQAAACCMLGTVFSYAYLSLLCHDIDIVKGTDLVPYWEADKVRSSSRSSASSGDGDGDTNTNTTSGATSSSIS
jgi:hypothetical protein